MEPQINYGGSTFPNQSPSFTPKIYGRSRFGNRGCFAFIGLGILILAIVVIGIIFAYPALTPNSIHGDFLDMTIVPQKDGTQKLWILTDGSFKFIQTTKSPGSYSTGVKCYFSDLIVNGQLQTNYSPIQKDKIKPSAKAVH